MENFTIQNNRERSQFEALIDGHRAELDYQVRPGELQIDHVSVPEQLGGRGVGGALVQAAVDWAQSEGLQVVPACSFARSYLERHPPGSAAGK